MSAMVPSMHLGFLRAVRGALVADAAFAYRRESQVGWPEVQESWMRLERNGVPTP